MTRKRFLNTGREGLAGTLNSGIWPPGKRLPGVWLASVLLACSLAAQTTAIPLDSTAGMKAVGVDVERATFKGKRATRVTYREGEDGRSLAVLPGIDFSDGTLEYEFASSVQPNSPPSYRGFAGLAFRVAPDGSQYECFYQRTLNPRSQDQEQRNHSVQYIAMPGFPWQKLRTETPSKYEAYVDMVPGEWTKVRIEVKGDKARIYINGAEQPTMLVNDLKYESSHGTLALWVGVGTVAHFTDLKLTR